MDRTPNTNTNTSTNMSGPHPSLQQDNNGAHNYFLNEIAPYPGQGAFQSSNEEFAFDWDPALFHQTEQNSTFPQQPQQAPSNYSQHVSQPANSPALSQYPPPQPTFSPGHYSQPIYDAQSISQPGYENRYNPRPSASPAPYEGYPYQPQMQYANHNYNAHLPPMQQRQTPTPAPTYLGRPAPPPNPYMNLGPRPPQHNQIHSGDMMHYNGFQDHAQQLPNSFVDPSVLTANHLTNMNGLNTNVQARQHFVPPYYSKTGSTVDPRALQGGPMPTTGPDAQQPFSQGAPVAPKLEKPAPKARPPKDPNAPKPPRVRSKKEGIPFAPRKDGQISVSESTSDSDDLSIDETPPEATPALLVVSAPTDERGKALYNAVQAVWTPRNKEAAPEKIRSGIASFGETVRSLRDAWKAKNDSLKKAELPNSPTAAEASRLKQDVAHYRQVMEGVMSRSLQYGHDAIVKRLGENQFTLSALYSFLLDRVTAGDYDSSLVSSILKFAVKFETVDEEMLEVTKWAKILQRFTKKASNESKQYAQAILVNAKAATIKKKAGDKAGGPASPSSSNSRADLGDAVARKDILVGMKRTRDGEAVPLPALKKTVVKPSSKPLALQNAERRQALEKEKALAAKIDKGAPNGAAIATGPKSKAALVAPPKSSPFSSLISASKKPGTSMAARAAAAAKDKPSTPLMIAANPIIAQVMKEVAEDPNTRPLASAAAKIPSSFLGYLADMEKPKEVEAKKEDEPLHETEEEKRKRVRREARRKLRVTWKADKELVETRLFTHDPDEEMGHADSMMRDAGDTVREGEMLKLHKDQDEVDDEEEDEAPDEMEAYLTPSEVDYGVIAEEYRADSYHRHGGHRQPESPCSEAQAQYEEDTLMAIYASTSDRPDTPKEPPTLADDGDFQPCADFGAFDERTRTREKEYSARLSHGTAYGGNNAFDLATQLQAIKAQPAQQPGLISSDLQRALSMLTQQSQSTPAPQQAPAGGLDLTKLFAVAQAHSQMQAQQQPQYQPAPPTGITPNLAALLAQMTGAQPQSQPIRSDAALDPNPYMGLDSDASRKHSRNETDFDDPNRRASNKKKKAGETKSDAKPYNYKTQVCSFWQEGKCIKGDACTYKHEDD